MASNFKLLTFVTGNSGKLAEVQAQLPHVRGKQIDLPEIQELDLQKIVKNKLEAAVALCDGPVLVDDTALYCDCFRSHDGLDGLPGPMIKWFLQTVTNEGLAEIVSRLGSNRARACTMFGYFDEKRSIHFFEGSVFGTIVIPQGTTGFGWDHIFIPDGYTQTFAAMGVNEKNKISPRALAVGHLKEFLKP